MFHCSAPFDTSGRGLALAATIALIAASVAVASPSTVRVSLSQTGAEGALPYSRAGRISADGRYVVFKSAASNLVSGDTNGVVDVFVRDLQTGIDERVSVSSSGVQGNGDCGCAVISADGRYVLFDTTSSNLVSGDNNGTWDVYLRDRTLGTTELISKSAAGVVANNGGGVGALSSDGRYAAFASSSTNLVSGVTSGGHVFLRDRTAGTIEVVDIASDGTLANGNAGRPVSVSATGNTVAFVSSASNLVSGDTNGVSDIFIKTRFTHTTERMSVADDGSQANGASANPVLNASSQYVGFQSCASNLVPGTPSGYWYAYLRNRQTSTTECVSLTSTGGLPNSSAYIRGISADARYVLFSTDADNVTPDDHNGLTDLFLRDRTQGITVRVSVSATGAIPDGRSEADDLEDFQTIGAGPRVVFYSEATNLTPDDANGTRDVFLRDLAAGTTTRVSAGPGGVEKGGGTSRFPSVDGTGRFVAFESNCSNLVSDDRNGAWDVFVRDTFVGTTERVSVDDFGYEGVGGDSIAATITPDGRCVSFCSTARNLAVGYWLSGWQVYVRDRLLGLTRLVSSDSSGTAANADCNYPTISDDGRYVAFVSAATNLVAGDTDNAADCFVKDIQSGATVCASSNASGTPVGSSGLRPGISPDGRWVAFASAANGLVSGDFNGVSDAFVRDMQTGSVRCASVDANGQPAGGTEPAISADGRYVVFCSTSTLSGTPGNGQNQVYLRDLVAGATKLLSIRPGSATPASSPCYDPAISSDGRYVVFKTAAANLVPSPLSNSFVYRVDTITGVIDRVVESTTGGAPNGGCDYLYPATSGDGIWVGFTGNATNLVANDTNAGPDAFIRGPFPTAPFSIGEVGQALRLAGGLAAGSARDVGRYDVAPVGASDGSVGMLDATAVFRKAAGLLPNP